MAKALIIVDVQNDFVEGGSLAVEGGDNLANRLAEKLINGSFSKSFDYIVTTQDWHIDPGSHFSDTPDYVDTWPVHCVADEVGSDFVPVLKSALAFTGIDVLIKKGQHKAAYSGFEGADDNEVSLTERLQAMDVTEVVIVGIATEHCVQATALHSVEAGFDTTIWTDYCAGIDDEKIDRALDVTLPAAGVRVI